MKTQLKDFKNKDMEEGTIFRAFVHRKTDGKLLCYIESTEELENFFKTPETGESNQWKNDSDTYHNYYKRQYSTGDNTALADYFQDKHDKFGGRYVSQGRINLALLRTQGLSNGVEFDIPETYSEETIKDSVESLKTVVEEIYKEFIRPMNVMTEIKIQEF